MSSNFDPKQFDVAKFDAILSRGLSHGLGIPGKQVCIEAAVCEALGLGHSDDPRCVAASVRSFKIALNDLPWSSPEARAKGLRDLGIAQLGSLGVVENSEFSKRIAEKTIRVLLPQMLREVFPNNLKLMAAAKRCEEEGTADAAYDVARATDDAAYDVARATDDAAYTAAYAACAAAYAACAAARAARAAARVTDDDADAACDKYLLLSAKLALEVLRELESPGVSLL